MNEDFFDWYTKDDELINEKTEFKYENQKTAQAILRRKGRAGTQTHIGKIAKIQHYHVLIKTLFKL